jgi:tetrahydromethanopterin S-methyltransferase subunit G
MSEDRTRWLVNRARTIGIQRGLLFGVAYGAIIGVILAAVGMALFGC